MSNKMYFAPLKFILVLYFLVISSLLAQTTIISDPLSGATVGQQVGGSFVSDGYNPGLGYNHIFYDVPQQVVNGYVEFQLKGFDYSKLPINSDGSSVHHGFAIIYDGRGISEPVQYINDFKQNFFRWNIQYRGEKIGTTAGNRFKAVINTAAPTEERLNATKAVFPDPTAEDRDWTSEPNGKTWSWNPSNWYTIKIEWNNKKFKVFIDGNEVWFNEVEDGLPYPEGHFPIVSPNDYAPQDLRIWLGSGPDKYDSKLADVIYRNFKLVNYGSATDTIPKITVTSPNGGENLKIGETHLIRWNSNLVSNVKIDYSVNNGTNWSQIISSTTSNGVFSWIVPDFPSNNCLIRIIDINDTDLSDISNSNFIISEQTVSESLTILTPNGGDVWYSGTDQNITWNYPAETSSIIMFYSTNFDHSDPTSATWTMIGTTPSDGSYNWTIPNLNSDQCVIRIKDVNNSANVDISDNAFTIRNSNPTISLSSPNGGEEWVGTQLQQILWESEDIFDVKIEYSLNNGIDWLVIVDSTESSGNYTWILPDTYSDECLVRLMNLSGTAVSDVSDSVFTIKEFIHPSIILVTPNGGEEWIALTIKEIVWNSEKVDDVRIEYSTNNGVNWSVIVDSTESSGNYTWNLPIEASNECLVRLMDLNDDSILDVSDSIFTIRENQPTIAILAPNGGEEWIIGTKELILWNSVNVDTVSIYYSINNGDEWMSIVDSIPSNSIYDWNIPNTPSFNCLVKIFDIGDSSISAQSKNHFTIATLTAIKNDENIIPEKLYLGQNYPNPFNPTTVIKFGLPVSQNISLSVYNILGVKVQTLVNDILEAGYHEIEFEAKGLPSGIYFYTIQTQLNNITKKLLLLK